MMLRIFIFLITLFLSIDSFAHDWSMEPTVQETQAAALRYIDSNPRELQILKRKSRWAAALPRLQFGVDHDLKETMSISTQDSVQVTGGNVFIGPDENDLSRNFNSGTGFEVKAIWDLNELVFNRDSLAVGVEQRNWSRERSLVASEVAQIYFARRKVHLSDKEGEERDIKLEELAARLDALTGGWFSRSLQGELR